MIRLAGEELLALGFRDGIPFTAITKSECWIHGWDIDIDCDDVEWCMSRSYDEHVPLRFPDGPDTYWAAEGVIVDCESRRLERERIMDSHDIERMLNCIDEEIGSREAVL